MTTKRIILISSFVLASVCGTGILALFGQHDTAKASDEAAAAPQAMPVDLTAVELQDIQIWKNFSGNVVAVDRADIRPQVSGRVTEILFKDGQYVEKGDVLIIIDPRPYEAALNQAKAELQAAKTQADLAEKEYQRAKKLIKTEAISQSVLDERTNGRQAAKAAVLAAEARVESAEINLDYAHVKAPIAGKVSRAEITVGNLVQSGSNAPLLTSIVADEKVYIDFEVDERTYLHSVRKHGKDDASNTPVRIQLASDSTEFNGFLLSFDNRIDPASGTIRARAIFDNKDAILLPGMSVTVLMGSTDGTKKILISERAIGTDQDRKFVYTVNGDGIAKYREIKIGDSFNGQRVVLSGLEAGEKVITEGIVRIRPGMPVMEKPPTPVTTEQQAEAETPAH